MENKEIEQLINYAIKEGYLDDEAFDWSAEQKESYYNQCQEYEGNYADHLEDIKRD
jgi:hypothetical protein